MKYDIKESELIEIKKKKMLRALKKTGIELL